MNDKFTVDFNDLMKTFEEKDNSKNVYKLADVKDKIEKVAFDIVRFRNNEDTDQLWRIEDGADGPVIVALYNDDGSLKSESSNDWEVMTDKTAMHLFYKQEPLMSLTPSQIGIPQTELSLLKNWLPAKIAQDDSLKEEILKKANYNVRVAIAKRFPELKKVASIMEEEVISDLKTEASIKMKENLSTDEMEVLANIKDELKRQLNKQGIEALVEILKED